MTRVLIAEDETIIRLDLKGLLEGAGFEVCAEARDGEEAVQLARETSPDVALLDVKMPRLDGIDAARQILEERPIPIVMVTAYGEQDVVSRAVEAGVFGYLVKPFRETDLLPAIATARARHDELVALREEAESLADALSTLSVASYGRNGKPDAGSLDAAIESGRTAVQGLRTSARWPVRTASAVLRMFTFGG